MRLCRHRTVIIMKKWIRPLLITIGALLILDTVLLRFYSNGNLGTYLPAVFGVTPLVTGIFFKPLMRWFQTHAGRFVKGLLLLFYAASVIFFATMGIFLYSQGDRPMKPADAVIVLGCGVRGERVSLTLAYRLDRAIQYLEAYPEAAVVVSGGQGAGEDIPEALAMQRYLVARGIDAGRIIMEDRSTSTIENFEFSKALIQQHIGPDASVAFVTTRFHVYRATLVANKLNMEVSGVGAQDLWYSAINNYLRESLAVLAYRVFGKI